MTSKYRKKFNWFDYHLHINNVPEFEYVYIHIGNTDQHTAGCLLVGEGATSSGECRLLNSTDAYKALYEKVKPFAANGKLTIEYRDSDMAMAA